MMTWQLLPSLNL